MATEPAPLSREDLARAILEKHGRRFLYRDHQLFERGDFVALAENLRRSARRTWWVLLAGGIFLIYTGTSGLVQGTDSLVTGGLFHLVFGVVLIVQGAIQHHRALATCDVVGELFPSAPAETQDGEEARHDFRVRTLRQELDESGGH